MQNFKIQIEQKPQKKPSTKRDAIMKSQSSQDTTGLQLVREESITKDKELFINMLKKQQKQVTMV